jgi:hypothetical protein
MSVIDEVLEANEIYSSTHELRKLTPAPRAQPRGPDLYGYPPCSEKEQPLPNAVTFHVNSKFRCRQHLTGILSCENEV